MIDDERLERAKLHILAGQAIHTSQRYMRLSQKVPSDAYRQRYFELAKAASAQAAAYEEKIRKLC